MDEGVDIAADENYPESQEDRDKFYQEVYFAFLERRVSNGLTFHSLRKHES